jgi:hypothetical protein
LFRATCFRRASSRGFGSTGRTTSTTSGSVEPIRTARCRPKLLGRSAFRSARRGGRGARRGASSHRRRSDGVGTAFAGGTGVHRAARFRLAAA